MHGANGYVFDRDVTLDASSVPAGARQVESFAVKGVKKGRPTSVSKIVRDTGLSLVEAEVPTNGTLELTFWNSTEAAINPASQVYRVTQT